MKKKLGIAFAATLPLVGVLVLPVGGTVMSKNGMVVTSHPLAAQAGLEILKKGGNAFDAAVVVAATLAVVEPLMSGLGGVGGYALIYDSEEGEVRSLDFIGQAPAAANPEAFAAGGRLWDRAHPARDSFIAPLVPGNLAGWSALIERYGTKTWPELLEPAMHYAENGFVVTPAVARGFADGGFGGAVGRYPYGAGIFFAEGRAPKAGDVVVQSDLAATFRTIANEGPKAYYGGSLATKFVDFFQENGGMLTVEDFEAYEARWQEPLSVSYRGNTVYSQPPGGSGMTVLQALNTLENFDVSSMKDNSPELVHLVVEAMKLAFVDEDAFNSGKDDADIPLERLLSEEYAAEQGAEIDLDKPRFYPQASTGSVADAVEHTTHHTVVDRDGNIVTMTQTLMLPAGVVVPGTGVIFNNGMSYFSLDPDDDSNLIEGGQRPRFVMSPTMVTRGGKPWLALGSAGGWTIPQTILQVLVRAIDFEMDAHEAVTAPRFVLRYLGNSIPYMEGTDVVLEKDIPEEVRAALEARGHRLQQPATRLGMLNAIRIYTDNGVFSGGADPRREGHVAAW